MKKRILISLLMIITLLGVTGCGSKKEKDDGSVMASKTVTIDGIYVDESFEDDNLGLVYLFYTVNAGDANLELASTSLKIKVNDTNEYDSTVVGKFIPKYTNYYYGEIIKKIYVGKSYKICSTFKVAKGDLEGSKPISISSYKIADLSEIKFTTDKIKKMDGIAKIAEDLDKKTYTAKYGEEQDKLSDADEETVNKVKNDINGYYLDGYVNVGKTIKTIRLEFEEPNNFTVSLAGLENSGTYEVKKGMITLDYGDGPRIFLEYKYEDGEITVTNLNEQFGTLVEYDPLGEE